MIEIGKLFNIEKGSLQSSKCTPGQYAFITAGEEWKTHIEYTHDCEALVFAMAASGSLGRTHYVNGKFIASDLCFILTPKKEYVSKVNLRFYSFYFNTYRERIVKATATGTSKLAINRKSFSNYQIYLVDIERQNQLLHKLDKMKSISDGLLQTIQQQQKHADMLRQSVLQQAVEGKLCEQDPKDEPASVLLKKIKAEKERLIAEKKIKKQKPLPPISEEKKPFDLPRGWEWCSINEIAFVTKLSGFEFTKYFVLKTSGDVPVIRAQNVKKASLDLSNLLYIDSETSNFLQRCALDKKCLVMTFIGAGIGDVAVFDCKSRFHLAPNVAKIELYGKINEKYLLYYLLSFSGQKEIFKSQKATAQPSLSMQTIREILIPLPPISEQQRIVEKVDQFISFHKQLKQEISNSQKYAAQLMESLLQEAFSVQETAKPAQVIELHSGQTTPETELLAAARGKLREDTWEHLCKRALEIAGEES